MNSKTCIHMTTRAKVRYWKLNSAERILSQQDKIANSGVHMKDGWMILSVCGSCYSLMKPSRESRVVTRSWSERGGTILYKAGKHLRAADRPPRNDVTAPCQRLLESCQNSTARDGFPRRDS